MYLVHECTTISAPRVNGDCRNGDANVLSTTTIKLCFFAMAEIDWISTIFSVGLVGVSSQTIFVFGLMAASNAPALVKSTIEKSRLFDGRATLLKYRLVPPYTSSTEMT